MPHGALRQTRCQMKAHASGSLPALSGDVIPSIVRPRSERAKVTARRATRAGLTTSTAGNPQRRAPSGLGPAYLSTKLFASAGVRKAFRLSSGRDPHPRTSYSLPSRSRASLMLSPSNLRVPRSPGQLCSGLLRFPENVRGGVPPPCHRASRWSPRSLPLELQPPGSGVDVTQKMPVRRCLSPIQSTVVAPSLTCILV